MTILSPPITGAIPFIDTSDNNESDTHQIDWPTLSKFLLSIHPEAGAIIKVSELDYVNKYLHRQRWGAHAAGLKNIGLYFFDRITATGAKNADLFIQAQGADGGLVTNEFLAGDFEDIAAPVAADLDAHVLDALGRIKRAIGIAPACYTGRWYADAHNLNRDPALTEYPLWWASYQDMLPQVPEPWASSNKGISLWQFTSKASLPGLPWECDVSWWLAGLPALRSIQWGYEPTPGQGLLIAGTPDVSINNKGEATDINAASLAIASNLEKARRLYVSRETDLDKLLATTQGDAVAISLVSGLLSH